MKKKNLFALCFVVSLSRHRIDDTICIASFVLFGQHNGMSPFSMHHVANEMRDSSIEFTSVLFVTCVTRVAVLVQFFRSTRSDST